MQLKLINTFQIDPKVYEHARVCHVIYMVATGLCKLKYGDLFQ